MGQVEVTRVDMVSDISGFFQRFRQNATKPSVWDKYSLNAVVP
jgi:hypothetical protein